MSRLAAVTGASGFVGGHTLAALAAGGWRIRILARNAPRLDFGPPDPVEVVPGSLSDPAALRALVGGADAVINVAGSVKARSRAEFMATNAAGAEALARAWRDAAPRARFVLLSSMAAREPGLSDYAASKREGEARVSALADGAPLSILRPCAVYGPGDRATLPLFRGARAPVRLVPGGSEARLCLVEATDLAAAVVAAIDAPSGTYEVSDERTEGYAWSEIAAALAGRPVPTIRAPETILRMIGGLGDLRARLGAPGMIGSGKIREALQPDWSSSSERQLPRTSWSPQIALHDGLAATLAWYRDRGWLRA